MWVTSCASQSRASKVFEAFPSFLVAEKLFEIVGFGRRADHESTVMIKGSLGCQDMIFVGASFVSAQAYEALTGPTGVLKYDKWDAYNGYTLFSPMVGCKISYLIDMEGNAVHKWKTNYLPGLYAELLPNGNLLRAGTLHNSHCGISGLGGLVQEIDWNGKVVWEYKMSSGTETQHHTFHRMQNGDTLILGWEYKSRKDAIAKGRDPKTIPEKVREHGVTMDGFWSDFVREVDKGGKTVWEWHAWDHIGTGPDKLDINYKLPEPTGGTYPNFDWTHFNTVDYILETDQILLNSRNLRLPSTPSTGFVSPVLPSDLGNTSNT
jgi:Arylsulfotransferase (ASST)